MKNGDVATTMAAVKLMSEGFKPDRDIIFFYSGDEETEGKGATLGSTQWRNLTDAEFGLNADGGCVSYDEKFRPLGCGISDRREDVPDLFLHHAQSGRAQLEAAARQRDLRPGRCARETAHASLCSRC